MASCHVLGIINTGFQNTTYGLRLKSSLTSALYTTYTSSLGVFSYQKWNDCGQYLYYCGSCRLDTNPSRDRQMDKQTSRQTDRQGETNTLLCLISIPPRIIVMRYQLYDFDKHTHSNKSTHLPLTVEVWIIFAWHVCEDDISLIINKNNLTITSFFHDNIVVRDCYLFFTCIYLSIYLFFFFFCGAFSIQANNAIYVWVMGYQSLEINYHTAPNNKSTALPILQKLISIMVCLLGRAEYTPNNYIMQGVW